LLFAVFLELHHRASYDSHLPLIVVLSQMSSSGEILYSFVPNNPMSKEDRDLLLATTPPKALNGEDQNWIAIDFVRRYDNTELCHQGFYACACRSKATRTRDIIRSFQATFPSTTTHALALCIKYPDRPSPQLQTMDWYRTIAAYLKHFPTDAYRLHLTLSGGSLDTPASAAAASK
jgi:hypothetical protein